MEKCLIMFMVMQFIYAAYNLIMHDIVDPLEEYMYTSFAESAAVKHMSMLPEQYAKILQQKAKIYLNELQEIDKTITKE